MNAGGSPMNAGGARHGRRRQEQGVKPKQQRHKCQACTRLWERKQTPTLLKLPVMADSTSALHSVEPAKLVTSGRGMCVCRSTYPLSTGAPWPTSPVTWTAAQRGDFIAFDDLRRNERFFVSVPASFLERIRNIDTIFLSRLARVELSIRKAVILFTKNGQRHRVRSPRNCHMKVCYTTI